MHAEARLIRPVASTCHMSAGIITLETLHADLSDLGGTFVFAISGAVAAVNRRLDIFGILVLSFVAGNFGGISRDLLIGAVPPAALTDERYLLVSVLAGLVTFFLYAGVDRLRSPVLLFDAAGLAFFAVAGAQKAIAFGLSPVDRSASRHVDRHRRRHDARHSPCRDPAGAAFRPLRGCGTGRRIRRRHRQCAQVFPTASRRWSVRLCASAFASWRSDTAGICRSRGCRRKDAQELGRSDDKEPH